MSDGVADDSLSPGPNPRADDGSVTARGVATPGTPKLPSDTSAPSGFALETGNDAPAVVVVGPKTPTESATAPTDNSASSSTTTSSYPRGVCPLKPQYIRRDTTTTATAVTRVTLDAEGKTRGMVKGGARAHGTAVEGTLRPTFEGEVNFLNGVVLTRVKMALRMAQKGKRGRQDGGVDKQGSSSSAHNHSHSHNSSGVKHCDADEGEGATPLLADDTSGAAAAAAAAAAVTDEEDDNGQQQQLHVVSSATVGDADTAAREALRSGDLQEQHEQATIAAATATSTVAQRRESAGEEIPIFTTTPEIRRAHAAQRQTLFGGGKLILAPLTTVGNLPFRRICVGYGADVTLGEMAVVHNLNHTQKSEWSLLRRHESESVFGLQIAVSRPGDAAVFAKAIEASGFSYDYIDINCGCPVDKLVQSGCGCGLWEKKSRLREVVQMLTKFQSKPVTIKCRIGADEAFPTLHYSIGEYEGWGASAVAIHGRSKKQRYTKLANWEYIQRCSTLTNLPVIGNGDIMSVEDAQDHRLQCPNVASMMIGRGALIKPWVFEEIKSGVSRDPSSHERFEMIKTFVHHGLAHWGADEKGVATTRRFLCEWLSFLCRYVPTGLLERLPQRINERPPLYDGRDDLETLMASDSVVDWIKISEMLLGPAGPNFRFTPKHRSNAYSNVVVGTTTTTSSSGGESSMTVAGGGDGGGEDEG